MEFPTSGVTTALVLVVLAGLVWPQIIRQRLWFYATTLCVLLIILFSGLAGGIASVSFARVSVIIIMVLQMAGIVLMFLAAGGFSIGGLMRDVSATVAPPSSSADTTAPPSGTQPPTNA